MNLLRVLIGAAGIASLSYLALRQKVSPTIDREMALAALPREVANWLPKLPFVPYIRIQVPGSPDYLQITGDDEAVFVHLPRTASAQQQARFRRECAARNAEARSTRGISGETFITCQIPADPEGVTSLLDMLLRELFAVHSESTVIAAVPRTA